MDNKVIFTVSGSKSHIGTTMFALLLGDELRIDTHTFDNESVEDKRNLLRLARAGYFTANNTAVKPHFTITKSTTHREPFDSVATTTLPDPEVPCINIHIFSTSLEWLDIGYWRVLLLLADIGYPNLLLADRYHQSPLSKPMLHGEVFDVGTKIGGPWAKVHTGSRVNESLLPYAAIELNAKTRAAITGKPGNAADEIRKSFGLHFSAEITNLGHSAGLRYPYVSIHLATVQGRWAIAHIEAHDRNNNVTIAFDRKHVYELLKLVGCENGGTATETILADRQIPEYLKKLTDRLCELNITPAVN